jgi:tetratricopeptide (TPR) repeat protein/transcriptional regulator with XRE-family HTH domain
MAPKPGSKAYRDQQRERLTRLGVVGRQLVEQLAADLMRCGRRPREAWRLAYELTQDEVAARFNHVRGDPDSRMRGSRICEYEKWPMGGIRPSVRTLKILATIYETSWDRLVDVDDLEKMPADDRQDFMENSSRHYGDQPNRPLPRQRHNPSVPRSDVDSQITPLFAADESVAASERLTVPVPGSSSDRSIGGLPGEITHFTGRDRPMAELRARITEQAPQCTVVTIYAIDGMAGVGKTAFARHAAQEFAKNYPDGAIWVDLYGHTPGMAPREPSGALEQMLLQLGVPPEAIKVGLAERQDQWRHYIHGRRMLIVLDNALTSDQVMPLLPEAPDCLVLITSRRKLTSLTDAYPLSLDVLEWDEAEQLLIKLLGEQRCQDRDAVRQILTACGRLPLAIRLIAGRLRHHRDEPLAEVAADLSDQTAALDALVAEHVSVRTAFKWSYRLLTDVQRQAFRRLGWHPGPEITSVVITALAAVPPAYSKQLLRELVDHNLLEQLPVAGSPSGRRYRMHDLVRLYAQERADAEEPPTERVAAIDRLAISYLAITREANQLLQSYIPSDTGKNTAQKTGTALTFADTSQARIWIITERHSLLGCIQAMSPSVVAADLSTLLAIHFRDFGFWLDARYLYGQALAIHRDLGDRFREVDALGGLGHVERFVGEYSRAREYHLQALTLAREVGNRRGEVDALWGLGEVERFVGEYSRAREYHTQALTLARHLGDQLAEADALRGLGQVERFVGEYSRAREYHTQALTLARQLGDRPGEADALRGLGHVERLVGEYSRAREYYTQVLALARQLGDRPAEGLAVWGLGQVARLVGEYGQAREYYTQALTIARELGFRRGEVDALGGLGEVARLVGEYGQAREYYTQALSIARELGFRRGEVDALWGLSEVARLVGEYGQAREHHSQALTLARHLGDRPGEAEVLRGLGEGERLVVEYSQARNHQTEALTIARHLGDRCAEVDALRGLGRVEWLVGEYDRAREYYTHALTIARKLGFRRGEVDALRGLGEVERLVGEYGQAREYQTQALILVRQRGDRRGEVLALRGLGHVERLAGDYSRAREYCTQALILARELGDRPAEADALRGLGQVERSAGDYSRAREYCTQALILARELGDRPAEADALRGLGQVERSAGDYSQGRQYCTQALILARHLGDRSDEGLAAWGLAQVERLAGDYSQARQYCTQALASAREFGFRRGEVDALRGLSEVERLAGDYSRAREYCTQALIIARELGFRRGEVDALRGLSEVERLAGDYSQVRE